MGVGIRTHPDSLSITNDSFANPRTEVTIAMHLSFTRWRKESE